MQKSIYQNATFLLSVAKLSQLPPDLGMEVAIVGRSNSGKSSVLNQLTQNKNLARVSKTPGRTQHINLFGLDATRRLADLPGYGYAKVPPAMKQHWEKTLDAYLRTRECLKGLILVMDIRHPLKEFDKQFLLWASACNIPVHILLNKSDKLSYSAIKKTVFFVEKNIQSFENPVSVQSFSAAMGEGIKQFKEVLKKWFEL
jgi:GTP-binding protein